MIVNGWVSWATRIEGVADKKYTEPNRGLGLIGHSIVGREPATADGIPNRFLSTERDADGNYTANAAASCMFILRLGPTPVAQLIQMYPVTASTWTSGGREANTSYWAIEAEGGDAPFDEPLNPAQVATLLRLCGEYTDHTGRVVTPGSTFREHGEVAGKLGYAATACPSNRYRTFYTALAATAPGTPSQAKMLSDVWMALTGGDPAVLTTWNARGNSVLLGFALEQERLSKHLATPHGGDPKHQHTVTLT